MSGSAAMLAVSSPAVPGSPAKPITAAYAIPDALQQFLGKLEAWAAENQRKALWDRFKFWSFKAIAILAACGSFAMALVNQRLGPAIAVLSGISAICVVLDGILRPGKYRNAHLRAAEGLLDLKEILQRRWQIVSLEGYTSSTLAEILEDGWKELKKIVV